MLQWRNKVWKSKWPTIWLYCSLTKHQLSNKYPHIKTTFLYRGVHGRLEGKTSTNHITSSPWAGVLFGYHQISLVPSVKKTLLQKSFEVCVSLSFFWNYLLLSVFLNKPHSFSLFPNVLSWTLTLTCYMRPGKTGCCFEPFPLTNDLSLQNSEIWSSWKWSSNRSQIEGQQRLALQDHCCCFSFLTAC